MYILITILFVIFVIMFYLTIYFVDNQTDKVKTYLNDVGVLPPSQIKNESGKMYRYLLIKNLLNMKKYVGISIVIIVLIVASLGTIIVLDSRTYFKDYFEVQRTKLNLRNEASVDSLLNVINVFDKKIDSLQIENQKTVEIQSELKKQIVDYKQSNINLRGVIDHQNKMIENLSNKK